MNFRAPVDERRPPKTARALAVARRLTRRSPNLLVTSILQKIIAAIASRLTRCELAGMELRLLQKTNKSAADSAEEISHLPMAAP